MRWVEIPNQVSAIAIYLVKCHVTKFKGLGKCHVTVLALTTEPPGSLYLASNIKYGRKNEQGEIMRR